MVKRRRKTKKGCKCGTVRGRPNKCRKPRKNGTCPRRRRSRRRSRR